MSPPKKDFVIGGTNVPPGCRQTVNLPVSYMPDHTPVALSVHVINGKRPGPTLFVSAAIHGDEVIGVEIARRLLRAPQIENIRGTLLVIPIVNTFGFLNQSRYLPDRRDLNRSFPGFATGSLTARLAHLFLTEVVVRSDFGIDLHSAAVHRTNLPQIRVSPTNEKTLELARVFGAPITIKANLRDGSLREVAGRKGVEMLLFEGGEALRFDELTGRVGLSGILRVMHAMGMIGSKGITKLKAQSVLATKTAWLRASTGGMFRGFKTIGDTVQANELLGYLSDPFGQKEYEIISTKQGIVIGRSNMPVVNEGDALFHIAETQASDPAKNIEKLVNQIEEDRMFDEDEII